MPVLNDGTVVTARRPGRPPLTVRDPMLPARVAVVIRGAKGENGTGSVDLVVGEVLAGVVDGSNVTFTTAVAYKAGSTAVYLNGIRQSRDVNYVEAGGTGITLGFPTYPGDLIQADYEKT